VPGNNPMGISLVDDTRYTIVKTGDGSYTLYLRDYDEHMHSLSGAYEEALLKHVIPSGITNNRVSSLHVLDVGFGLGYNILALVVELKRSGFSGSISVTSLEKDRSFLPALQSIHFDDSRDRFYSLIQRAYHDGSCDSGGISISVLFGDARKFIRTLPDETFDAVFFDPFSPAHNPELWSVDLFTIIRRSMKETAILTTYSCAPQVRAALLEAEFIIGRGPSVGGKREGTLAARTPVIAALPAPDVELLLCNRRAVPYRDPLLSRDRDTIIRERSGEIKRLRSEKNI